MMEREKLLTQLEVLRQDTLAWRYDLQSQTYTGSVGDYTITVKKVNHYPDASGGMTAMERGAQNATWSVRHERYGVLVAETPASIVLYAKRDAIEFTRSHVLGYTEPVAAE